MRRALSLAWLTLRVAGTLFAIAWAMAMLAAFPPDDELSRLLQRRERR